VGTPPAQPNSEEGIRVRDYSVVTSDDHKAGHVVDEQGEFLIVEFGTLRKHKHVLPKAFAHVREGENVVNATVTWDVLKDSPTLDSTGAIDDEAVGEHYGLVTHFEDEVPAEGLGETIPGRDPAYGPDEAAAAGGQATAEQQRVALREELANTGGRDGETPAPHVSPGITGGDRYRDAPGVKPAND
jgi:hypothetical protein